MKIENQDLLFKALVGSRSYHTDIESSDFDYKGVFIQNPKDCYLNGYKPLIVINKDEEYYEIGNFLNLCRNGSPALLELLYSPDDCVEYTTDVFESIRKNKKIFLNKSLRHSFSGYAEDQIKKAGGLDKMMNWEKKRTTRTTVQEMCFVYDISDFTDFRTNAISLNDYLTNNNIEENNCGLAKIEHFKDAYLLYYSKYFKMRGICKENANEICLSNISKELRPVAILYFHRDAYSSHCKDYKQYLEWLEKRNTQRYVDVENHDQKIDGKNLLHCTRIIEMSIEIPIDEYINIKRPNAKYLIDIRKGKYDLATIQKNCEENIQKIHESFITSNLPDKPVEKSVIEDLIKKIRLEYYS